MNPNLDRQPRQPPGRWPYPADDPTTRARKIALMYRAALGTTNPNLRDECDATAVSYGETWMIDRPQIIEPDQEITGDLAAELVHVSESTIRKWATMDHPEQPGRKLLPACGWSGRRRTYLAVNVLAAAAALRRAQHARRTA